VQIKTRVAGMLAVTASAVALMGAPAFASDSPVFGNIVGDGNLALISGNSVMIPVDVPIDVCGVGLAVLGLAGAGCDGGAAVLTDSGNTVNNTVNNAVNNAAPAGG
jgi:hypothetical protein